MRFWIFAFETATYLINRMPSRTSSNISPTSSNISPFEHLLHRQPDLSFLRVFGCQCFPHLRPYNPHKMDFRSLPCIFLGYSSSHHGYQCLDPITDRIYVARHVRFNEAHFPLLLTSSPTTPTSSTDPYFSSFPSPNELPSTPHTSNPVDNPSPTSPTNTPTPSTAQHTQDTSTTNQIASPPTPPAHHIDIPTTNTVPSTNAPASHHPQPPLQHTYSRRQPTQSTNHNYPPTTSSTTQSQLRPRPENLRQNPKQRTPYNASFFHTLTDSSSTEPSTFAVANKSP